jgi:hypothetical protein
MRLSLSSLSPRPCWAALELPLVNGHLRSKRTSSSSSPVVCTLFVGPAMRLLDSLLVSSPGRSCLTEYLVLLPLALLLTGTSSVFLSASASRSAASSGMLSSPSLMSSGDPAPCRGRDCLSCLWRPYGLGNGTWTSAVVVTCCRYHPAARDLTRAASRSPRRLPLRPAALAPIHANESVLQLLETKRTSGPPDSSGSFSFCSPAAIIS